MSVPQNPISRLGAMRLFEALAPDELRELTRLVELRSYQSRTVIFRTGDRADRLYFLDRGIVKLSLVSPDGAERVLDVLCRGNVFGELFFSQDDRRTVTAESLSPIAAWTMPIDTFTGLLRTLPVLCLNFVRHLTDVQRRILSRLLVQMEADRGVRLLAVLLELAERCGRRDRDDYMLPAELTQAELAHMIGVDRSTVSSLLNRYRRSGVLGGHGAVVVVHAALAGALLRKAGILPS